LTFLSIKINIINSTQFEMESTIRFPEIYFNVVVFTYNNVDIKNLVWKPTFDVIVSDCILKFVFGTRIPKSN